MNSQHLPQGGLSPRNSGMGRENELFVTTMGIDAIAASAAKTRRLSACQQKDGIGWPGVDRRSLCLSARRPEASEGRTKRLRQVVHLHPVRPLTAHPGTSGHQWRASGHQQMFLFVVSADETTQHSQDSVDSRDSQAPAHLHRTPGFSVQGANDNPCSLQFPTGSHTTTLQPCCEHIMSYLTDYPLFAVSCHSFPCPSAYQTAQHQPSASEPLPHLTSVVHSFTSLTANALEPRA